MSGNKSLSRAKNDKNDEFYTRLEDIENELYRYEEHFRDKIVFLCCDDPYESMFWFYFHKKFASLGLKKLISTHYNEGKRSFKLEYVGGNDDNIYAGKKTDLEGDGDFRSEECVELLKESDVVVTNPPFSCARSFIAQLIEYNKKFLFICNQNALTYKEIFPLFKEGKMWIGYNKPKEFYVPEDAKERKNIVRNSEGRLVAQFGNILWFTNLDIPKRHQPLDLVFYYEDEPEKYPSYDNYDAIEVSRVVDIPADYEGVMGVPITFLDKYNPSQFEILGLAPERLSEDEASLQIKRYKNAIQHKKDGTTCSGGKVNDGPTILHDYIPNKFPYYTSETVPNKYLTVLYARVLIRNKNPKTKKEVLGL